MSSFYRVTNTIAFGVIAYAFAMFIVLMVKISSFVRGKETPWHSRKQYLLHRTGPFLVNDLWPFVCNWWFWPPFALIAAVVVAGVYGPKKFTGFSARGGVIDDYSYRAWGRKAN